MKLSVSSFYVIYDFIDTKGSLSSIPNVIMFTTLVDIRIFIISTIKRHAQAEWRERIHIVLIFTTFQTIPSLIRNAWTAPWMTDSLKLVLEWCWKNTNRVLQRNTNVGVPSSFQPVLWSLPVRGQRSLLLAFVSSRFRLKFHRNPVTIGRQAEFVSSCRTNSKSLGNFVKRTDSHFELFIASDLTWYQSSKHLHLF